VKPRVCIKAVPGMRSGRLTVVEVFRTNNGSTVKCRCDCGSIRTFKTSHVFGRWKKFGACAINGCSHAFVHGQKKLHPREYDSWWMMKSRCFNPDDPAFHNYGGRGITVCERWLDVKLFISDMGPRPTPKHTVERVNNDGNYEPANCRWATRLEQARNMRTNRRIFHAGQSKTISEWTSILGFGHNVISDRLKRGWSDVAAVTTPKRKNQYA
jgi:hypothetical protein